MQRLSGDTGGAIGHQMCRMCPPWPGQCPRVLSAAPPPWCWPLCRHTPSDQTSSQYSDGDLRRSARSDFSSPVRSELLQIWDLVSDGGRVLAQAQWFPGSDAVNIVTGDAGILPRMVNNFNSRVVRGNVRCELWMQGPGKMLDISLIIFGSGREMMNDMRCGGRGRSICSIFPPLFNLIRSEFKAEWVSKILPVIQIPDSVLEGDDASQSQAALERPRCVQYLLLQQESTNITCDWLLFLRMRRVALNWMRHWDVHWAPQLVTQECVCSWLRDRRTQSQCWRWILSGQNCNMQGHLCYLGSSALNITCFNSPRHRPSVLAI